jgi:hypothetical protein
MLLFFYFFIFSRCGTGETKDRGNVGAGDNRQFWPSGGGVP